MTTMTLSPDSALRRWTLPLLTAILLLAATARILHIEAQSFWIDEGATYFILRQPDLIAALATRDHHPPLYYILLKLWLAVMGESVVAYRMFSALPSILSVAFVVPLARELNRGRAWFRHPSVPILAALLLALSDPEVVLAQDARMYALRTLLTIWSLWGYLRWVNRPSPRRALWWLIPSVAILHTQYQGIYIIAVEGLYALFYLRGSQRIRAIGYFALIGALFAPWAFTVGLQQRNNDPGIQAALPSNWATLVEIIYKYFSRQWALMIGLLLLGVVMFLPAGRLRWRPSSGTFILVSWLMITLGFTFIFNLWYPVLAPHRILLMSPAIAILTAQGLRNFPAPARAFLVAVILAYGISTVDDYYPKEPWREVAASMAQYAQPNELALLEVYRGDNPLTYHLEQVMPPNTHVESLRQWREFRPEAYPAGVLSILAEYPTVWFMHWSPDRSGFDFLAQTGHVQTAALMTEHVGNQLTVYRFDKLSPQPVGAFQNGMILRQARILPDELRVDLWWSAADSLPVDYTVSAFLLDEAGGLAAQHDAYPLENRRPTTTWGAGEIAYDPHPLQPTTITSGRYTVAVQIYTWFDNQRVLTETGEPWMVVGSLER